ncbi:hypothetical protein WA158_005389 [Blastocystis sp. Blastoise]
MGRVCTKTVKKTAAVIVEKYYQRLTNDFEHNKKVTSDVTEVPSKKMRNKIAGYVTHFMKRIQTGPVRGISLKLQEEERERRLDFVPSVSVLDKEQIDIDPITEKMVKGLKLDIQGLRTRRFGNKRRVMHKKN